MQGINGHQIQKLGLKHVSGSLDTTVDGVTTSQELKPNRLAFLSGKSLPQLADQPSILIVEKNLASEAAKKTKILVFECDRIKPAMALVLALFDRGYQTSGPAISPHAFVSPSAKLGANVRVLPGAVIEDGAIVGSGSWIGSNAVIEQNVVIGDNCRIHSNAVIGHHCKLGHGCIIHSGTNIGSDGFGFVQTNKGPQVKVPQVGNVEIGDMVELGGNCSIDRATIGSTRIADGCKFDNLCHVAHNCQIGPHGLFAGGFFVAGSSKIGAYFSCGGNVVVTDHVEICDHVMLGGLSAVTKDITEPGAYTGYPLEPLKDGLRTINNLRELTSMRKDLAALKKRLE